MKVRLLADLTKYNKHFELGALGNSDMEPFRHPNINWQDCYNVEIDGEYLAVGESSIEVLGENDLQAQAKLVEERMHLAEKIDKCKFVAFWQRKDDKKFFWNIFKNGRAVYTKKTKQNMQYKLMTCQFVEEYVTEAEIPYVEIKGNFNEFASNDTSKESVTVIEHIGKESTTTTIQSNRLDAYLLEIANKIK